MPEEAAQSADVALEETMDSMMESIAEAAVKSALPDGEVEEPQSDTPTPEDADTGTVVEAEDAPAESHMEAPASEEKAEARKPITPFTVHAADGSDTEAPDVLLSFKANGKQYDKVPLDKVVRFAQSGIFNEELSRKANELELRVPQVQQERDTLARQLDDQKAFAIRLLSNDDFLLESRQAYANASSPEARAQRAEQQLATYKQQQYVAASQAEGVKYAAEVILPEIEMIQQANPSISTEEMWGKFSLATAALQRNGQVPRELWPEVVRRVKEEIAPWAEQVNEQRSAAGKIDTKKSSAAVTKAQEEATKAKRQLAKAIQPSSGGTKQGTAKTTTAPRTAEEAADQIVDGLFN